MSSDDVVLIMSAAKVAADTCWPANDGTVMDRMAEERSRNVLADSVHILMQAVRIFMGRSASAFAGCINIYAQANDIYQ